LRCEEEWGDDCLIYELQGVPCCDDAPKLTGSVDACIALAERLLPGWNWFLAIECGDKEYCAKLFDPSTIESLRRTASADDEYGATPALAMLGAILSAVRGRQQGSLR
jgi:hypothetical protein